MQEFRLVTLAGCRVVYCLRAVPLKNPTVSGSTGQEKNVRIEPSSLGGGKVSTPQTSPGMNADMIGGGEHDLLSSCLIIWQWSEILRICIVIPSGQWRLSDLNACDFLTKDKISFYSCKTFFILYELWSDCTYYYKRSGFPSFNVFNLNIQIFTF